MATSIFTELAQKKREAINKGIDVIDLSVVALTCRRQVM